MTPPDAPVDTAYAEHRAARNAARRWFYALLLVAITLSYLAAYVLAGELVQDGQWQRREFYAIAFGWLTGVGLLGLLAGRRPRGAGFDDTWVLLLLAGMIALVTLDAARLDLTAYVLIGLPVAVVHSGQPYRLAVIHAGALLATLACIALANTLAPDALGFLVTLAVCCATAIFVTINLEQARRQNFHAARNLDDANRALANRTELLAQANAQLLARHREAVADSEQLARVNAELAARGRLLEDANRRLEQLALTDPLTGVANRRQLLETLEREFGRWRRYGNPLALGVIDLDDFGQINKLHGVIAGDQVLAGFAAALQARVRGTDLAGRYGGEEFVVVLPDSSEESARQMLERLREQLQHTPLGSRGLAVSFSAGVTGMRPGDEDPLAALERADEAMRLAKREGKNRIVCAAG